MSHAAAVGDTERSRSLGWLIGGLFLIGLLYLPTLLIPFDFADDGALLYPMPAKSLGERWSQVWQVSATEFQTRGPYRPVCWAHWHAEAVVLGEQVVTRRVVRLGWALLGAALTIAFLRTLRFPMPVAVTTTTLAFFNPYRNEIWLAFGLTESFALPYAMLALLAAVRAARAPSWRKAWRWDIVALVCLLFCLGIKNTFAALIPPMLLLRVLGDDTTLREGWRRSWFAALLIAATTAFPAAHFILYKMQANPESYKTALDWNQLPRLTRAVLRSGNLYFAGIAFLFAGVAIGITRRARPADVGFWPRRRLTVLTALALLVFGIGIYAPINGLAGRYTLPAVWGFDLLVACLLAEMAHAPATGWAGRWARGSRVALVVALVVAGVFQLGREWKVYARNELLGQALRYVEQVTPAGATVIYAGTKSFNPRFDELTTYEGIQFQWHLHERGRLDIRVRHYELTDADAPVRVEPPVTGALVVVTGGPPPEGDGRWRPVQQLQTSYWAGTRLLQAHVWVRDEEVWHGRD